MAPSFRPALLPAVTRPCGRKGVFRRGQVLERGARARRLVGGGQAVAELAGAGGDGDQVGLDLAVHVRLLQLVLAGDGVGVRALLGERREAVVQVLCGRAHHQRGGIHQLLGDDPGVGVDALAHRVVAHVLDPAGDGDLVGAEGDRRGAVGDGGHRAGAHAVDGVAGGGRRQAGQEAGHPSEGQSLVADLGGGGDGHLLHALGRQVGVTAQQLADAVDDEVVGAGLGVDALLPGLAERGADPVDEHDLTQGAGHRWPPLEGVSGRRRGPAPGGRCQCYS